VGWAKALLRRAHHLIADELFVVGTPSCRALRAPLALPTLIWGFVSQGSCAGLSWSFAVEGRRAEPCVAQRDDRAPGEDWLPTIAAPHCITSYPVGSYDPYPHSACLRRGSHQDETHLQNGLVGPWVARSSSILRGCGLSREPPVRGSVYAFIAAPSGTSPVVR